MFSNRRQRGFTLLELLIVLAIIGAGLVVQMYRTQLHAREKLGEAQSDILVRIAKAETDYHNKYFSQLTQGQAIAGVADPMNPTVAELQGLGLLDAATSPNNFYGGGYSISLTKAPAACVYPSCFVSGLVRLTTPVVNKVTGVVDARALGAAVFKAGGDAGFSDTTTPSLIAGEVGGWSLTNPAGAVAGILAMRTGYGSSTFDPNYYLPRDGSKPMFGDLDMGTKSITNVTNVTGTGKATFNTAQINTDTTIGGQATITKLAGKLQINKVAVEGTSCADASLPYNGSGQLAQDGNGLTLSCQSDGKWHGQALGSGQAWQDVRPYRAWATNYQNTTGRPILVRITAASKVNSSINFLLDGRTFMGASANLAGEQISNEILVPPGAVYAATGSIGALYSWDEMR